MRTMNSTSSAWDSLTLAERGQVQFLRHIGMPAIERLQRMPVGRHLPELERSQWWPPEQLRALQELRLRRLVQHAFTSVPLYRRLWAEAGVHPDAIRGLDDLPRLPLTNKRLLRAAYPDRALAQGVDRRLLVQYASSGSTGEPFQFVMSRAEKGRRWAAMFRCWAWAGAYQGVRQVYIKDGHALGSFSHGPMHQLEQLATGMVGLSAYDVHDVHVDAVIAELQRYQPKVINTYPATGHRLALEMEKRGARLPLRAIITSGEVLFSHQREAMERWFGCQVHDFYGGEGMDVAFQCGQSPYYHINVETTILEVTDEEGRPLPPGQPGQIVLTNLINHSMPFVRYAIGDVGTLAGPGATCPCGRGLPLLDYVTGRSSDQLTLPSGRQLLMWYFTDVFRQTPGIDSFQMRQEAPDRIVIRVVPGEGFGHLPGGPAGHGGQGPHTPGAYVGPEGVVEDLHRRCNEQVRDEAHLEIVLVDTIPSGPGGKRRFFVADPLAQAAGHPGGAEMIKAAKGGS